jgi:hypothetical protein
MAFDITKSASYKGGDHNRTVSVEQPNYVGTIVEPGTDAPRHKTSRSKAN